MDYQSGILDMESLLTEYQNLYPRKKVNLIKGPIELNSVNEFMVIYSISDKDSLEKKQLSFNENEKTIYMIKIYKKPDEKKQMIIRNYNK